MKLSNEIKVAVLVIIAAVLLYFGFNFIKGSNVLSSQNTFHAVYENVNGLLPGNPVMLNGLKIGLVNSCEFTDDGKNNIIVSFNVDEDVKIPNSALANIEAIGLLGDMQLVIDMSSVSPSNAGTLLQHGDQINGQLQVGMVETMTDELLPVKDKLNKVMGTTDSLIVMINEIVASGKIQEVMNSADRTINSFEQTSALLNRLISAESKTIHQLLDNLNTLTNTFAASTGQLDGILKNTETFSNDLTDFSSQLKDTDVKSITDELNKTIASSNATMQELNKTLAKINDGTGSMGMLINDPKLYNNIEQTTKSLDNLLVDLKENPKKYVQFSLIERKKKKEKESND